MTETAPERLGAIRTALAELVDEHGSELLSDPARMSNLIKDLLPDDQQLARILVIAAEQDVAAKLRELLSQGMDAATATRLVATSFAASTMFAPQACLLVVSELAIAMGLASGESTTPVRPVAGDSGPTPLAGWPSSVGEQDLRPEAVPGQVPVQASSSEPVSEHTPRLRSGSQLGDLSRRAGGANPGSLPGPGPRPRRGLYLALAATAVVLVVAAVILGIKIGSAPPASHGPAAPQSPATSKSPAASHSLPISHAPASGNFVINRRFFNDGSLVLTLTTIKLRDNLMTVHVNYHNATSLPQILSCLDDTDPSASSVTLADGTVIHSAATYCSQHPSATFTVNAGGTHTSYAVFHVPAGFPEPFSFFWPTGNGSRTVSNIKI